MKSIENKMSRVMRDNIIGKWVETTDNLSGDMVRFYITSPVWQSVGFSVWTPIADC